MINELKLDIVYNEDCLQGLRKIPSESIDLIIADLTQFNVFN